jgi:hypothetical protein
VAIKRRYTRPTSKQIQEVLEDVRMRLELAQAEVRALTRLKKSILAGAPDMVTEIPPDFGTMTQGGAAEEVIKIHGPLRCMKIVDLMLEKGFPLPGRGPIKQRRARLGGSVFSVLVKLAKRDKVHRDEQGRWHRGGELFRGHT